MSRAKDLNAPEHWLAWINACRKGESSRRNVEFHGPVAALTGGDCKVLGAIAACWRVYSGGDRNAQTGALAAVRALLPALQPQCHGFARELIAQQMDWTDRAKLWPLVAPEQDDDVIKLDIRAASNAEMLAALRTAEFDFRMRVAAEPEPDPNGRGRGPLTAEEKTRLVAAYPELDGRPIYCGPLRAPPGVLSAVEARELLADVSGEEPAPARTWSPGSDIPESADSPDAPVTVHVSGAGFRSSKTYRRDELPPALLAGSLRLNVQRDEAPAADTGEESELEP